MTEESSHDFPIFGYTDTETVKLDHDEATFSDVKKWAIKTLERFGLEGFLILKSSEMHYHVVFNRPVTWAENLHVVAWVVLESKNEGLKRWLVMQCIKRNSTLRLSPKGNKPAPRIVYRHSNQDKQIQIFLSYRKQLLTTLKKLNSNGEKSDE